mmetsp:Transcript_61405/g.155101  ORF Transcript_61405/g.155101 Transcript_61405/m.155101 type:complete len:231 (-) Transcript_61405:48-740(-)
MDALMLQPVAEDLAAVVGLLEEAAKETPEVLVKPSLARASEAQQELRALIAEAQQGKHVQLPDPDMEDLRDKAAQIASLLAAFRDLLDAQPWLEPPKLRKLRQTGDAAAEAVFDLRKIINASNRRLLAQPRHLEPRSGAAPIVAVGMAGDALAQGGSSKASGGVMDVDEALAMLLEKKTGGYRGGLCGIVHAAGVQEMVPFPQHSPGKFEFVFAAKCSAAFNLHQLSSMI